LVDFVLGEFSGRRRGYILIICEFLKKKAEAEHLFFFIKVGWQRQLIVLRGIAVLQKK